MSDHLSGPRVLRDPVADLTDLYFYPVPGRPGWLAFVINSFPGAPPGAAFSDALRYRVRLAPAEAGADGVLRACPAAEVTAEVRFDGLDRTGVQDATLRFGPGTLTFRTGEAGSVTSATARVFAGLRRDPFFMDVRADVATRTQRKLAFTRPGTDAVAGQNVLAIVVEFDAAHYLGAGHPPLWAAAAEILTTGAPAARFERVGRPEMKNVLLAVNGNDPVNLSADLRDLYNMDDPFAVAADAADIYRTRLDANLALLDQLDGDVAWQFEPGQHHPLTETLVHDYLILDTTRPFCGHGYLGIERAALTGQDRGGRGGRWLNEDVIDALYTVTVGGWDGPPVGDGVDQAAVPAALAFPYLAPANPHPPVPEPGVPVGPQASARAT